MWSPAARSAAAGNRSWTRSRTVWERYCSRAFWNPETTNNVCNLGFREVYKSLTLWSRVEKAEVTCKQQLTRKIVSYFKILYNNTLAVIMNNTITHYRDVEYYNMENMKLISRECYDFFFMNYDENDKLIALINFDKVLCVITKSNKNKFFVGRIKKKHTLLNTEVYFVNEKESVCVARLKVVDMEEMIETEELGEIPHHGTRFVAFSRVTENSVNMLTNEGKIYCYPHPYKDIQKWSPIDFWRPDKNIQLMLSKYGFHWSDPNIYEWLKHKYNNQVNIVTMSAVIHLHNHVVLTGTSEGMVHIYKRPLKKNGELILCKVPNRSINMNEYNGTDMTGSDRESKIIKQLGIIEILNGHRVVVLTENKLFFVDLVHKQHDANKRSATRLTCAEASTSSNKKAKTVKKRPIQSKVINNNKSTTKNNETSQAERKENVQRKSKTGKKNKKATNVTTKYVYNTRSLDKSLLSSNKSNIL